MSKKISTWFITTLLLLSAFIPSLIALPSPKVTFDGPAIATKATGTGLPLDERRARFLGLGDFSIGITKFGGLGGGSQFGFNNFGGGGYGGWGSPYYRPYFGGYGGIGLGLGGSFGGGGYNYQHYPSYYFPGYYGGIGIGAGVGFGGHGGAYSFH